MPWRNDILSAANAVLLGPQNNPDYENASFLLQNIQRIEVNDHSLVDFLIETDNELVLTQVSDGFIRRQIENRERVNADDIEFFLKKLARQPFLTDMSNIKRNIIFHTAARFLRCHAFPLLFDGVNVGQAFDMMVKLERTPKNVCFTFKFFEDVIYQFSVHWPRFGTYPMNYNEDCNNGFEHSLVPSVLTFCTGIFSENLLQNFPDGQYLHETVSSFFSIVRCIMFWKNDEDDFLIATNFFCPLSWVDSIVSLVNVLFKMFNEFVDEENVCVDIFTFFTRIANLSGVFVNRNRGKEFFVDFSRRLKSLITNKVAQRYREGVLNTVLALAQKMQNKTDVMIAEFADMLNYLERDVSQLFRFLINDALQPKHILDGFVHIFNELQDGPESLRFVDACFLIVHNLFADLLACETMDEALLTATADALAIVIVKKFTQFSNLMVELFDYANGYFNGSEKRYFSYIRGFFIVLCKVGDKIYYDIARGSRLMLTGIDGAVASDRSVYIESYEHAMNIERPPNLQNLSPCGSLACIVLFSFRKIIRASPNLESRMLAIDSIRHGVKCLSSFIQILRAQPDDELMSNIPDLPFYVPDNCRVFATILFEDLTSLFSSDLTVLHDPAAKCLKEMALKGYFSTMLDVLSNFTCIINAVGAPEDFYACVSVAYLDAVKQKIVTVNDLVLLTMRISPEESVLSLREMNEHQIGVIISFYKNIAENCCYFERLDIDYPLSSFLEGIIDVFIHLNYTVVLLPKMLALFKKYSRMFDRFELIYQHRVITPVVDILGEIMLQRESEWIAIDNNVDKESNYTHLVLIIKIFRNFVSRMSHDDLIMYSAKIVNIVGQHLNTTRLAVPVVLTKFLSLLETVGNTVAEMRPLYKLIDTYAWVTPFFASVLSMQHGKLAALNTIIVYRKVTFIDEPTWKHHISVIMPYIFHATVSYCDDADILDAGSRVIYRYWKFDRENFEHLVDFVAESQVTAEQKNIVLRFMKHHNPIQSIGGFRDSMENFCRSVRSFLRIPI